MCGAIPLAMAASGKSLGKVAPYALSLLPGMAINSMGKKKPTDATDTSGAM